MSTPQISTTAAAAINNSGAIVGTYRDLKGVMHGFLRNPDGSFFTVDEPHAAQTPFRGTAPADINAAGEVVGSYVDSAGIRHGFALE